MPYGVRYIYWKCEFMQGHPSPGVRGRPMAVSTRSLPPSALRAATSLPEGGFGAAGLRPPLTRVSKAQSAVVNDSPVGCQSRRPGRPQAAGTAIAVTGGEIFFFLSVCGARQPLRLTKQACVLPTAAHTALALDSATGGGQARGPPSFARTSQMPPPSQREAFHYRRLRFAYPPRGRLRGLRVLTVVLAGQ